MALTYGCHPPPSRQVPVVSAPSLKDPSERSLVVNFQFLSIFQKLTIFRIRKTCDWAHFFVAQLRLIAGDCVFTPERQDHRWSRHWRRPLRIMPRVMKRWAKTNSSATGASDSKLAAIK